MAYGPVNVPGASGGGLSDADLEEVTKAVKSAQDAASAAQQAADEAKRTVANLEKAILDGEITISTKTVFPVVDEDPENPEQGEAWILKNQP